MVQLLHILQLSGAIEFEIAHKVLLALKRGLNGHYDSHGRVRSTAAPGADLGPLKGALHCLCFSAYIGGNHSVACDLLAGKLSPAWHAGAHIHYAVHMLTDCPALCWSVDKGQDNYDNVYMV